MGNLDPMAEEFRPTNPNHRPPPPTLLFRSPPPLPPHSQPYYVLPYVPTPIMVQLQSAMFVDPIVRVPSCPQFSTPVAAARSTSPTRSLLLSLVPSDTVVSESTLTRELEASFGDVRGVGIEGLCEGMVMATVHFYNLQHAEAAFTAIRWHRMQHHKTLLSYHQHCYALMPPSTAARGVLWAQYIVPACDYGQNQGTIVVFNLDSKVEAEALREIFDAFGPVKELRHAPLKKNQRFVEYFDIRDAAKALKQMNGKEIHGKRLVIEFSRPGRGHYRNLFRPPPHHGDATSPPSSHCSHMEMESDNVAKGDDKHTDEEAAATGKERRQYSPGPPPKINSDSIGGTNTTSHQQQEGARIRNWNKGKYAKNKHQARFLIKEQDTTVMDSSSNSCMDSRTTVMIKNIPNKYSQKLLLKMLDTHCNHCNEQIGEDDDDDDQPLSSYDFVYLPIDFNNRCNVGYGFVNMTSPVAALRLYKAFHRQQWQVFNSRKICEVTYARVQGLEALKEHFKKSKFPHEMEQYFMPVVFSPPRDGRRLTRPLVATAIAILGRHDQNGVADDDEESTGSSCCSSDHELLAS